MVTVWKYAYCVVIPMCNGKLVGKLLKAEIVSGMRFYSLAALAAITQAQVQRNRPSSNRTFGQGDSSKLIVTTFRVNCFCFDLTERLRATERQFVDRDRLA